MADRIHSDLTPAVPAGNRRVLLNGYPSKVPIRVLSEENFQRACRLEQFIADLERHCLNREGLNDAAHAAEGEALRKRAQALLAEAGVTL